MNKLDNKMRWTVGPKKGFEGRMGSGKRVVSEWVMLWSHSMIKTALLILRRIRRLSWQRVEISVALFYMRHHSLTNMSAFGQRGQKEGKNKRE